MGIVNLFGDVTYEGGASINGPFLGSLGASAAAISIIAGFGEFLGYSLRSVSGWIADRSGRYWPVTFVGYVINLFAVPAMALAGNWKTAGALILAERIGRAIRKPTIEAMLSYSTGKLGKGWGYVVVARIIFPVPSRLEALLKAIVAGVLPEGKRSFAFGLFYTGYGSGWLIGSVTTGLVYKHSIPAAIAFSVAIQMASIPIFIIAGRRARRVGR